MKGDLLQASCLQRGCRLLGCILVSGLLSACMGVQSQSSGSSSSSSSSASASSAASSSTGASSSSSSSSASTSSSSSASSSSGGMGILLPADNHYLAKRADVAPVIDGQMDAVWGSAHWMAMSVAWTGFENLTAPDNAADFSGKYKALWTTDHLYLLLDITDDVINTSGDYWQQDTVELFIDEDQSGGQHNHSHNAFAYHISHTLTVVDNGGDPEMIASHINAAIHTEGNRHLWEIQIEIYSEHNGYVLSEQEAARVQLLAGKIMGFTPSYIDNDGNGGREHFMSSVDSEGHQTNQGYLDADSFGSIELIE